MMKRWILRALLLLLIGASINIAVAWGRDLFPVRLPPRDRISETGAMRRLSLIDTTYLQYYTALGSTPPLPPDPQSAWQSLRTQRYQSAVPARVTHPRDAKLLHWSATEVGLPFRCLWAWTAVDITTGRVETGSWIIRMDVQQSAKNTTKLALPSRIIWVAMVTNVIAWAGVCAVVPLAFRRITGALRRRKGLCPACKYPLGSSPVCTECGRSVLNSPMSR